MIHIATVHWRYDRWIDLQLRYLERHIDQPFKVYAWIDEEMRDQAHKFFYSTDVPIKQHELKLTLLGDIVAQAAEPEEMIMFIDGDAFPVAPIVPFLREKLQRYPIVAVRRDENNGDPQPHPSFCVMKAGLWRELPGDWRRGATWVNPQGKEVTDVGGNLHRLVQERGIDWYPMLRTNKVNPHPLQFGVYEDLVYHHGGGFRLTAGGRLWRAAAEDRLNATLRGRLVARLPRKGLAGSFRKFIHPVRRYREALGAELARINEQVFDLIQRDEQFYLQLIDADRGGELATIKAPVVLEDVKQLSATR
jgi:hypothetical protein